MAFGGLGLLEVQAFRPSHGDIARGISARRYQSLRPQSCESLSLDFYGVSRSWVGAEACGMPPEGAQGPLCLQPGEPRHPVP